MALAVRAISLTGSSAVGRIVGATAAKSFKHCSLELGGKNPMIVLDDANLELAVEGGLWGAFGTTGQRCTATSRIIVQKGVYREFIDHFVSAERAVAGQQRLQHLTADRREFLRPRRADPLGMGQPVRGAAVVVVVGRGKSRLQRGHYRDL